MGKRFAILIGVAAVGVMLLGAGRASASHVSCGDTITTDTTLDSDLINCPDNGIVIGADNVTLDLNGHTIDGDGTLHSVGGGAVILDSGVSVILHDGITVKDGSIRQFGGGLEAVGTRHIRLLGLAMSRNRFFGITLAAASRILVQDCSVNRTIARVGAGLFVGGAFGPGLGGREGPSDHVRIVNSSFRHNVDGIRFGSKDSVIKGNLLSDNRGTGIDLGGDRNRLSRNRIIRHRTGILVHGSRNVIARNRVSHSRREGVGIVTGRGNLLTGNVIAGAATGIRIRGEVRIKHRAGAVSRGARSPSTRGDVRPGAVNTVIRGNRLRGAKDDGLLVDLTAKHTLLWHNIARHSQDDGFDVNDRTTTLTGNRGVRNDDLGIEAVPGVIDGGGNRASGNGDPRQCVNVRCH